MAKDLFSKQAADYAKYRPTYPPDLFEHILSFVQEKSYAWDCATGNGQAAQVLATHFKTVEATDLSEAQLKNAVPAPNIRYRVSTAEETPFADNSFDLITIATAYHWFDAAAFFKEATRVGKKGAVVAAWSYHLVLSEDEKITALIHHFYHDITKPYWDKERTYVDNKYQNVPFDFGPLPEKEFTLSIRWNKEAFRGYFGSWSAVQHYIQKHDRSPIQLIEEELQTLWPGDEEKEFYFPIFLRLGRVEKE